LENNTDFVYMLSNGIPLVKFVDGEERKVWNGDGGHLVH
jgi:hypothetical protein